MKLAVFNEIESDDKQRGFHAFDPLDKGFFVQHMFRQSGMFTLAVVGCCVRESEK